MQTLQDNHIHPAHTHTHDYRLSYRATGPSYMYRAGAEDSEVSHARVSHESITAHESGGGT